MTVVKIRQQKAYFQDSKNFLEATQIKNELNDLEKK